MKLVYKNFLYEYVDLDELSVQLKKLGLLGVNSETSSLS